MGSIRHCTPLRSNCWGRPLWTGGTFSLNPNSGPVCPACNIGVALFAGLSCICEWPISASTPRCARAMRARGRDISARMAFCLKGKTETIINHDKDAVCAG